MPKGKEGHRIYDGDEILADLLAASAGFRTFYRRERPMIPGIIQWRASERTGAWTGVSELKGFHLFRIGLSNATTPCRHACQHFRGFRTR